MDEKASRSRVSIQYFSGHWKKTVLPAGHGGGKPRHYIFSLRAAILAFMLAGTIILFPARKIAYASPGDWSTYLASNGRQGFNGAERIVNLSSAPNLKLHWTATGGGVIFSQPVEANGTVYWGSLDGNERATNLNGGQLWQQNLGQTPPNCDSTGPLGVVSSATVASVSINGVTTSVVFVGGGNGNFYALNASNGAVIWKTSLAAPSSNRFIWGSPAIYNGSAYIAIASIGDCPLVQGQIFQMNVTNGAIQHTFNVVPNGCTGGGAWGSPTIDQNAGALYIATSNSGSCSTAEPYTFAMLKLRASDLSFISSWQVPTAERTQDSDFGSTPTLFQANINGSLHSLVGVANKNGTYYAFDSNAISNGPLWRAAIAVGGQCPECGDGSISPSAWDGTTLYVAGGNTTINGSKCRGSLRALNPATGAFTWQSCMQDGPVLGAVSLVPGVAAVVEGPALVLVATASGKSLFSSHSSFANAHLYGSASISNGVVYTGGMDGKLYAFGT